MLFTFKNLLVLLIGMIQAILGGIWFAAFFSDYFGISGQILVTELHFSIHILFGVLIVLGVINIFLGIINLLHIGFKFKNRITSSLSISLLTVILTCLLLLMIRYVLSLSYVTVVPR